MLKITAANISMNMLDWIINVLIYKNVTSNIVHIKNYKLYQKT